MKSNTRVQLFPNSNPSSITHEIYITTSPYIIYLLKYRLSIYISKVMIVLSNYGKMIENERKMEMLKENENPYKFTADSSGYRFP